MTAQAIDDVAFAFVDTETTGLSPKSGGRVCEIAVLKVRAGKTLESFCRLVDPGCPIDFGARMVHGITDEMVAGQPRFADLADAVEGLLADAVFVGHNANFDLGFLASEFRHAGREMPKVHVLDTLRWARRHYRFPSNRLGAIVSHYGLDAAGAHRAGRDADLLRQVFERFLADFRKTKEVRTLEDLLKL